MADRFDVAEALAGGCPARADAWAFIRDFAAAWSTPLSPTDGFSSADVQRAEDRLGLRLPAALREAYALFGRRRDLVAQQNPMLEPDELLLDPSGDLLVFRSENQGCAGWGVALADLSREDPPVALFGDRLPGSSRLDYRDRFSLACVETVLSEAASASGIEGRTCQATPEWLPVWRRSSLRWLCRRIQRGSPPRGRPFAGSLPLGCCCVWGPP